MKAGKGVGIEAIVLAAGSSRRLGRPKALLEFEGRTALEILLEALRTSGIARGAVVVGEHREAIARSVNPVPLSFVDNPSPQRGRMGSLQVGLSATATGSDVLIWPVDRPLARAATVRALLETRGVEPRAAILVPETDGGRGHPFLVRASLRPILLAADPDANLRRVLADSGAERREVAVADWGIHFNLDTEQDFARAAAWWRANRSS